MRVHVDDGHAPTTHCHDLSRRLRKHFSRQRAAQGSGTDEA
jgi:hypothetical protein